MHKFKQLATAVCLTVTMAAMSDSLTEVLVRVKSTDTDSVPKITTPKPRQYPKYKTIKLLISAYATAWNAEDYDLMYHLLSSSAREDMEFSKFKRLIIADKAVNGGLKGYSSSKQLSENGSTSIWSLTLIYKFKTANSKNIRATFEKAGEYWFIKSGGLLPPDYSPFDR
jgi:hypothetical protein